MDAVVETPKPDAAPGDPLAAALGWLRTEPVIALATVISTWGSSPVRIGGQMAICADGRFQGSVSGGCVEAEVIYRAADVMTTDKPQTLEFGVSDNVAQGAGLPCGGRIRILLEPFDATHGATHFAHLFDARRRRKAVVVATSLDRVGREIFGDDSTDVPDAIRDALRTGQSRVIETEDGAAFVQAHVPRPRLIIVGATHIGQVLAGLAANLEWDVAVVDPRTAFASEDRFGQAARYTAWPDTSLAELALDSRTAVAVVTHVDHIDDEALIAALASPCFYVGALGSRRNHAGRVARLERAGVATAAIAKIRAPIGLAIGAEGPHEIAISILAEIVRELRASAAPANA